MNLRYLSIFAFLLILACGQNSTAETTEDVGTTEEEAALEQAAYESMIAAHDRVMPRMGEISRAQIGLRDFMAQEGLSEEQMNAAKDPFERLEAIHDGMMNWMQEAMQPLETVRAELSSHEEVMDFYREKQASMEGMEEKLDPTFQQVNALLGNE